MQAAAYGQKGTLVPGQSIAVNKYTVQVERYLSQGGFAHVYLVRTATPVYGTTHHVLKRIAVASEAMLTEVKKEVDIMRLLQGHPNIVHLIDAAWHRMTNGQYEVFILMEYCPGGGIIDMMNRRLHERLTEAEILQIFVDVCEGVACMHNLRPPLLHRDLKVENILQSSPTSFKLCDFGSATTVATRPPATTQEIRALEADLNRHTTLQYRAPEMVDPYLRRPVDEKSDVWALGVLLYKLCYYTTPFEEHGPLAILNVQYRIPPFPVYSPQMNALIASMLREHGTQRPSVFELLNHVHHLRGTKSQFHYNVPQPPPLSPRQMVPPVNPLENTISYRDAQQLSSAAQRLDINGNLSALAKTQGVQAREKVLEAIAPMRRGRPTPSKEDCSDGQSTSKPLTSQKPREFPQDKTKNWLDSGFSLEGDKAWNSSMKPASPGKAQVSDDAWIIAGNVGQPATESKAPPAGFGDSFSGKVWVLQDPNKDPNTRPPKSPQQASMADASKGPISTSTLSSLRLPAFTGTDAARSRDLSPAVRGTATRDAFEGLGLDTRDNRAAPTLGEARKLRTGLASINVGSGPQLGGMSQLDANKGLSIPRTSYLSQPVKSHSPTPSMSGPLYKASSRPSSNLQPDGLPAESRFPSLAELDATFASTPLPSSSSRPDYDLYPSVIGHGFKRSPNVPARLTNEPSTSESMLKPSSQLSRMLDGTRSEQVTGIAMREPRFESTSIQSNADVPMPLAPSSGSQSKMLDSNTQARAFNQTSGLVSRPSLIRKPPSSISAKTSPQPTPGDLVGSSSKVPEYKNSLDVGFGRSSPRPSSSSNQGKDWLTGDLEIPSSSLGIPSSFTTTSGPVVRDAPSKRTSMIERAAPRQSIAPERGLINTRRTPSPQPPSLPERDELSPTVSRFARAFPPVDLGDSAGSSLAPPVSRNHRGSSPKWSPKAAESRFPEVSENSSGEEEPEEAHRSSIRTAKGGSTADKRRKGRQSSVHELVDLWSGSQKETTRPPITSSTSFTPEPQSLRTLTREPSDWLSTPTTVAATKDTSPRPSNKLLSSAFESDFSASRVGLGVSAEQRKQAPSPGPSPRSSRPQSMFIFPSKSTEATNLPSPSLAPPEEPRPRRNLRRTSISDMVQHFEAIGGKPKLPAPPGPPSPVTTRVAAFKPSTSSEGGRFGRSPTATTFAEQDWQDRQDWQDSQDSLKFPSDSLSPPTNASSTSISDLGDPTKRRASPRMSPVVPRTSPYSSQVDLSPSSRDAAENIIPRPRTSSTKPEPVKVNFPLRRTTMDEKSASSPRTGTGEAQPASPERPYQGVGKLIDQWQRKTAEAEAQSTVPKRTPFPAKRAGVVQGRGQ